MSTIKLYLGFFPPTADAILLMIELMDIREARVLDAYS